MKTPHLGITHLVPHQIQRETTVNDAFITIDALMNNGAISRTIKSPPNNPQEGDVYLIPENAQEQWQKHTLSLTYFSQIWHFITPNEGLILWINDEDILIIYNGKNWIEYTNNKQNNEFKSLGINAKPDNYNKFIIQTDACLFNHNGNNTQIKLNKATEKDTVSQLFQSNYSTYAEWGLVGSHNFSLKVSPDGQQFHPAISVSHQTASVTFYQDITAHCYYQNITYHTHQESNHHTIDLTQGFIHHISVENTLTHVTFLPPKIPTKKATELHVICDYKNVKKSEIQWDMNNSSQKTTIKNKEQETEIYRFILCQHPKELVFYNL